jgi:CO/xanthine dehydrogenase Mo-binding subunit
LDYGIPRADTLPPFTVDFSPVPSPTNPLGAKGIGEGGAVAGAATVMNAILDALAPRGRQRCADACHARAHLARAGPARTALRWRWGYPL